MNRKIPQDAFDFYYALGHVRSYEKLAERYGVCRRAIAKLAAKEHWKERVLELDATARKRATEKLLESAEEMNARHLKVLKFIQAKSIEAIKSMPIESAMDGVRAYTAAVNQERLIRGEPTDRTENVKAIIRREYERWLVPVEEKDGESEADDEQSAA